MFASNTNPKPYTLHLDNLLICFFFDFDAIGA